jgi:hypothetical protein
MKTQTIYGLISDSGDGSSSIVWFRTQEQVDKMLDEDNGYESYWAANEGGPSETLTFPADLDLEECGFYFLNDED